MELLELACRTLAIGDIHGCSIAFSALLEAVAPEPGDTIILLGDLIDRGPNSSRVISTAIELSRQNNVICVLGDHEELMLRAIDDNNALPKWLRNGGVETLHSYGWAGNDGRSLVSWFPIAHLAFLRACLPYYETEAHVFTHAGYVADLPMNDQPALALRWRVTSALSEPHMSGRRVIVGHTAQRSGNILDLGHLTCIDTNCARGGWLTGLDPSTGRFWQANQGRQVRSGEIVGWHDRKRDRGELSSD